MDVTRVLSGSDENAGEISMGDSSLELPTQAGVNSGSRSDTSVQLPLPPGYAALSAQLQELLVKLSKCGGPTFPTTAHCVSDNGSSSDEDPPTPQASSVDVSPPVPGTSAAPDICESTAEFAALLAPASESVPPVVEGDFDLAKLGLAWGSCYPQDEVPGPDINQGLADLVTKHVRNRPVDEQLRKLLASMSIPGNCVNLTVPQLNPELEEVFSNNNAKITERVLARITAISFKAMAPIIVMLNDVLLQKECLQPLNSAGLSNSLIVLSSIINIANQGRKLNLQNSVEEPLLKHICKADTKVGDKLLFDFNVCEKLTELKKANKIGQKSKGLGFNKSSRRPRSYRSRSQGGFRGFRQNYTSAGQRGSFQGGSQPFLPRGQRGRGKTQR